MRLRLAGPKHRSGHIWLAATQAQLGQVEDAREQTAVVLRLQPDFTISKTGRRLIVFKFVNDDEHLFDGPRIAGLPE